MARQQAALDKEAEARAKRVDEILKSVVRDSTGAGEDAQQAEDWTIRQSEYLSRAGEAFTDGNYARHESLMQRAKEAQGEYYKALYKALKLTIKP